MFGFSWVFGVFLDFLLGFVVFLGGRRNHDETWSLVGFFLGFWCRAGTFWEVGYIKAKTTFGGVLVDVLFDKEVVLKGF